MQAMQVILMVSVASMVSSRYLLSVLDTFLTTKYLKYVIFKALK